MSDWGNSAINLFKQTFWPVTVTRYVTSMTLHLLNKKTPELSKNFHKIQRRKWTLTLWKVPKSYPRWVKNLFLLNSKGSRIRMGQTALGGAYVKMTLSNGRVRNWLFLFSQITRQIFVTNLFCWIRSDGKNQFKLSPLCVKLLTRPPSCLLCLKERDLWPNLCSELGRFYSCYFDLTPSNNNGKVFSSVFLREHYVFFFKVLFIQVAIEIFHFRTLESHFRPP